MKVYFLSSRPCALTLNGSYFGITDGFERFAEISLKDNLYALFSPENAQPIGCFINDRIRFSPPDGFEVYLLPDGLALYARDFPPRDFLLHAIDQQRREGTLATLFLQGELQLSIESEEGFFIACVPPTFARASIRFIEGLIGLEGEDKLALYTVKGERVFCENVRSFRVEEGVLTALLPLSDALGRTAECSYALSKEGCKQTGCVLRQTRTEKGETTEDKIAASLLPFAFFESVLLGLDYKQLLSDELSKKADYLVDFLGDFIAVAPRKEQNACGLVRKKGERLYEVVTFFVEVKEGKIVDIRG